METGELKLLQSLTNTLAEVRTSVKTIESTSAENSRALRGSNGEPGVLSRMVLLEEELKRHSSQEAICPINHVTDTLYGRHGGKGLVDSVRELTEWKKEVNSWVKWLKLAVAGLAIDVVARLLPEIFRWVSHIMIK